MAFGASKPDNPVRPVTPVKPVHTPAAPKPVTPDAPKAEASDPWAAVLDAPIAPTFVRGSRVDVEKDIPASIRKALEISLQNYGEEMKVVRDGKAQTLKARTPKYRDLDRKSTRLNSSHHIISSAAFSFKKTTTPHICNHS